MVIGLAVPVLAQSADSASWTSAITYYTPSTVAGTLQVTFYAEGSSTGINATAITLAPHKAGSLQVGTVSGVPSGFKGSAVLSSDVPVLATNVEIASAPDQGNYARSIYNGMTASDAASTFYVPSALRAAYNTNSQIGVQNVESFDAAAVLTFIPTSGSNFVINKTISSQSSIVFKMSELTSAPDTFNGSLVVTAAKSGDPTTPAKVLASAVERDISGRRAKSFEGVANGGTQIFMASMMCTSGSGTGAQTSTYAIQNAGGSSADYSVTFYDTTGAVVGTVTTATLASGAKISISACAAGVPTGKSGSAVINATAPVIAIGKVAAADGTGTVFGGATAGATTVVAPYIRWSTSDYFTNIAIMNVGSATATNIQVKYYDGNGTLAGTHTISSLAKYIKASSNASLAGALTSGAFGYSPAGGAVEITSDQPIVVVVRAAKVVSFSPTTKFAEDYNGVPYVP